MLAGTLLYIRFLVYAGLSLFIINGLYVYMVVCVVYAYHLTIMNRRTPQKSLTEARYFKIILQNLNRNNKGKTTKAYWLNKALQSVLSSQIGQLASSAKWHVQTTCVFMQTGLMDHQKRCVILSPTTTCFCIHWPFQNGKCQIDFLHQLNALHRLSIL